MKVFATTVCLAAFALSHAQGSSVVHAPPPAKAPPSAEKVVMAAQEQAAKSHKNVYVSFHASWCGWCKRMTAVLEQPAVKSIMDKYYVMVDLVTLENGDKKALENAGAETYMAKAGGTGEGIPFFYITDTSGKMLINSRTDPEKAGTNIGCPYQQAEQDHFSKMLTKTSKMTAAELKTVIDAFKAAAAKDGAGGH